MYLDVLDVSTYQGSLGALFSLTHLVECGDANPMTKLGRALLA